MYGSVFLGLLLCAWPWWVQFIVVVPLGLDYWQVILMYGLRTHKHSVASLTLDCDKWLVQLFSGTQYKGHMSKDKCYYSSIVLIIFISNKYYGKYIIVPRDALSTHQYRFLAQQINHQTTSKLVGQGKAI